MNQNLLVDQVSSIIKNKSESLKNLFKILFFERYCSDDENNKHIDDDLLFLVKNTKKNQLTAEAVRSKSQMPAICFDKLDFEKSFYLNFLMHEFQYVLTAGVKCLNSVNPRVKASDIVPIQSNSYRMDKTADCTESAYPNMFFPLENHDNIFDRNVVWPGETLIYELAALDKNSDYSFIIFRGSVDHAMLYNKYKEGIKSSTVNRLISKFKGNKIQGKVHCELDGPRKGSWIGLCLYSFECAVTKNVKANSRKDKTNEKALVSTITHMLSNWELIINDIFVSPIKPEYI